MRKKCSICGRVFTTNGKTNICKFCQKELRDKKRAKIWNKVKPLVIGIGTFITITVIGAVFDKLGISHIDEMEEREEKYNMDQKEETSYEHTVWAHKLADINEKIYETNNNLKEAHFSLNDSETSLKLAKDGRIYSPQMIPQLEERIAASKQYISELEEKRSCLDEELQHHFENEPQK